MTTGKELIELATRHIGEHYIFGARAPKNKADYKGPWDCAEFISWTVYQLTGKLYGCYNNQGNPETADAYTGYWKRDAETVCKIITLDEAIATPGAIVLRAPATGMTGHIVFSSGDGKTVEAYSSKYGVISSHLSSRRWNYGVLIPEINYVPRTASELYSGASGLIYRLTSPLMHSDLIKSIQTELTREGFNPGPLDGYYGQKTYSAVIAFQILHGLAADGEVGPKTFNELFK